jgi:hypothetical protein
VHRIACFLIAAVVPAGAQTDGPREILRRALDVTGMSEPGGKILHTRDQEAVEQNYQSNPPFLTFFYTNESWFDPATGIERVAQSGLTPGSGPRAPQVTLRSADAVFALRNGAAERIPGSPSHERNLNPLAVLADFRAAPDVRAGAEAEYAGYTRKVLLHRGEYGEERLYVDPKSGFPVKLDLEEPHYLWGQVHVEYVYMIWSRAGEATICTASARVMDGFKEITRTMGAVEWIAREAAPDLAVPADPGPAADPTPPYLQAQPVSKVEVDGSTFLSVNRGYTEAIAQIGDTVYVFDATQGEARARQDLELIEKTFGAGRKIAVVVTDTAWPHIAGVRFWVAQGATIISHRESRDILARVVERRWTRTPDLLEQRRKRAQLKFEEIDHTQDFEDGRLRIIPIDGIGSEGALMAWIPGSRFLWASDYIQSVTRPTAYAAEVAAAVRREGMEPEQVAAQHIGLTSWKKVEELVR